MFPCEVKNIFFTRRTWRWAREVASTHVRWDWNEHWKWPLGGTPIPARWGRPDGGARWRQPGRVGPNGVGPDGNRARWGQGIRWDRIGGQMGVRGDPNGSRGRWGQGGALSGNPPYPSCFLVPHLLSLTLSSPSGTPSPYLVPPSPIWYPPQIGYP